MPIRFPIDTQLKDGSAVRLALAEPKDIESLRQLYNVIVDEGTSFPHEQMPSDGDFQAYWFGGCGTVMAFARTGTDSLELAGAYYVALFAATSGACPDSLFLECENRGAAA